MKVKKQLFNFEIFNCFWYICSYNISLVNADVRPERLVGMSPIARHIPHPIDVVASYQEVSDNEEEIARNLEGLTHVISEYAWVADIPRQYQRHTVEV